MNGMRQVAVEDAHRPERHIDETVPARSFHQLNPAALRINLHDHERPGLAGNPNHFARAGDPSGKEIGFDNNA